MVAHRRNILRCAPEHVRHVTEEEKIIVESPESELLGIKNLLSQGQFPRNQFIDLLQQSAPPDPSVCANTGLPSNTEVARAPNASEVVREARETASTDAVMSDCPSGGDITLRVNKIRG